MENVEESGPLQSDVLSVTLSLSARVLFVTNQMVPSLSPRQLGVGIPGGCEAAVHSARKVLDNMPSDKVMVKLDFTNAFSCLHISDLLSTVASGLPELYAYCYSPYYILHYHICFMGHTRLRLRKLFSKGTH